MADFKESVDLFILLHLRSRRDEELNPSRHAQCEIDAFFFDEETFNFR